MGWRDKLLDVDCWSVDAGSVEFLETHISELYFVGDRVFKIKKPVDLGFLDFRTLEARHFYCEEELRLNRRLSPDVYLGVREIRMDQEGRLQVDGEGRIVDYAVEMARLPADRMLDHLLDRGDLDNGMLRSLCQILVDFHAGAERSPLIDRWGIPEAVRDNALENFDQTRENLRGPAATVVSPVQLDWLETWTRAWLSTHEGLLSKRVSDRRICDGHGDLHAGNICFLDGEMGNSIRIYDCLEFAPRYRQCDVACDLAFLLMDLDFRGYRAFASYLQHEYIAESGDHELDLLIPFYKSYRACVRAKVALLRSLQLEEPRASEARAESSAYYQLSISYGASPALVVLCGLPACGKSRVAPCLARPFEARILSSDHVRKRQHGLVPEADGSAGIHQGIYSPGDTLDVYAELTGLARECLSEGRSVIVDAGFRTVSERARLLDLAREMALPCTILHLEVPESVTRARLEARALDRKEASDADWGVYQALAKEFEPCDEVPAKQLVTASGESAAETLSSIVLDSLLSQIPPKPRT